jgi:hypothetical protein
MLDGVSGIDPNLGSSDNDNQIAIAKFVDICDNNNAILDNYLPLIAQYILGYISKEEMDRNYLKRNILFLFRESGLLKDDFMSLADDATSESTAENESYVIEGRPETALTQIANESFEVMALPSVAPELYQNRERPESPIAYYNRVWRRYAKAGVLYQDQLRKLDPKLIPAIHTYCSKHDLDPSKHLPPPRHERTKKLAASGDKLAQSYVREAERKRELRAVGIEP